MAAYMIGKRGLGKCFPLFCRNYFGENGINQLVSVLSSCNVMENRSYSKRALRRKPIKVIIPTDEGAGEMDQVQPIIKPHNKIKTAKKPELFRELEDEQEYYSNPDSHTERGSLEIPHYIRLGNNTTIFTQALTIAKSRKAREKNGKILLEGKRLIKDALQADILPEAIFFSLEENIKGLPLDTVPNLKIYKVMYKQLQLWSNLTTCPGVMGVFKMPMYGELRARKHLSKLPLTVICDNIREPGNLGAIIRCVAAAGCHKLILAKGCVDAWEPKVLRSGAGAHFHIEVANSIEWELMNNYVSEDSIVYVAENNFQTGDDEGDVRILNNVKEPNWYEVNEDGEMVQPVFEYNKLSRTKVQYPIEILPYHQLRVDSAKETILVIGGETHGLSDDCYQFAIRRQGAKLAIPLCNDVESLNSSVAAGIIIFEILRQLQFVGQR